MERRMKDAEIGGPGVPHAKAGVVFGGEHDVADTGQFGERSPVFRIEFARIKRRRQLGKEPFHVVVGSACEGVTDDHAQLAIEAPVDEQSEALVAKPLQTFWLIARGGRGKLSGDQEKD